MSTTMQALALVREALYILPDGPAIEALRDAELLLQAALVAGKPANESDKPDA